MMVSELPTLAAEDIEKMSEGEFEALLDSSNETGTIYLMTQNGESAGVVLIPASVFERLTKDLIDAESDNQKDRGTGQA